MDANPATSSAGGGGGPAPFLLKTYEMVDDSSTDEIVSWSAGNNSFIVWNPPEFARILLPTYFKHNNFSSFIRQLNTYGFRKIDPEKWEFANEEFIKDQKHLLKNIHRRKPIHSHSQPPTSVVDPERAALDEEIERLSREKAVLESKLLRFKQQKSAAKLQFEELTNQVDNMEQRQEKLLSFLQKAVQNPNFVEQLADKIDSFDVSAYNKKRRIPQSEHSKPPTENFHLDNSSSCRAEFGDIFQQDFSNKLRLELSPAVSDMNLVSQIIQSSNEDGVSSKRNILEGDPKGAETRTEGLLFSPETLELSDTGSFPRRGPVNDSTKPLSSPQKLAFPEDIDGGISCHLNLTLASSPLPANKDPHPSKPTRKDQEFEKSPEFNFHGKELNLDDKNLNSREAATENRAPTSTPARVNDVFWEQFLTERPGSSDNEEASSTYRGSPDEDSDDRRTGNMMSRNTKNIEQLTL